MAKKDSNKPALVVADETKKKVNWNLPVSVVTLVEQYTEFYGSSTGRKVTEDQIVAAALEQALAGDKAFQKWEGPGSNGAGEQSPPRQGAETRRASGGGGAGGGSTDNK